MEATAMETGSFPPFSENTKSSVDCAKIRLLLSVDSSGAKILNTIPKFKNFRFDLRFSIFPQSVVEFYVEFYVEFEDEVLLFVSFAVELELGVVEF